MRLLLIGSLYPPASGTVVSLKHLIGDLEKGGSHSFTLIDSGRISQWSGITGKLRFIPLILKIFIQAKKCDVICPHLSPNAMAYIGPFLIIISRIWHKPIILRMFGGLFYGDLDSNWKRRSAGRLACAATPFLAQTHELIARVKEAGGRQVEWFPTSRPVPSPGTPQVEHSDRAQSFLFVGQLKREKGVLEMIEALGDLPEDFKLTIHGPLNWNLTEADLSGHPRVTYGGELSPDEVSGVIRNHDVLLLPSFMDQEGYPGVIIEAYAQGRPVIVTNWKALPEMVDHESSGLIVEPRSTTSLSSAMLRLYQDRELYSRLCEGAWNKRIDFSSLAAKERYLKICRGALVGDYESSASLPQ